MSGLMCFVVRQAVSFDTWCLSDPFIPWSQTTTMTTPSQNVKGTVVAAIRADAAEGAASGIQQLEDAVSGSCEKMLLDPKVPLLDKLKGWSHSVEIWLASEPKHPLVEHTPVSNHATFGRLKAQIDLHSCCCSPSDRNDQCSLHGHQLALADLVWEVTSTVYHVFDENFMAFANTLFDATSQGECCCCWWWWQWWWCVRFKIRQCSPMTGLIMTIMWWL